MKIDGKQQNNSTSQASNLAEYIVCRLADLGIEHVFCMPGDYAFPLNNALISNPNITYVGAASELNASYAADGYARAKGAGVLCTTFGVGMFSAINGVMGSKAENIPVFWLIGTPAMCDQIDYKPVHHTWGDGDFKSLYTTVENAGCVSAYIDPNNAEIEMDRVIKEVFQYRRPGIIFVPADLAKMPCINLKKQDTKKEAEKKAFSNPIQLEKALNLIVDRIANAKNIIAMPDIKLRRYGIESKAEKMIEKLGIPFVSMIQNKTVIPDTHPNYMGCYQGIAGDEKINKAVNAADLILDIGGVSWCDTNGDFPWNNPNRDNILSIFPTYVKYQGSIINEVYFSELLDKVLPKLKKKNNYKNPHSKIKIVGKSSDKITELSFYTHLFNFLTDQDNLVVETGSSSVYIPTQTFMKETIYYGQPLWESMGWATPASLGINLATPNRRTVLVTGEGAHQLTANEIGNFERFNLKPVIFCINNGGYMIDRALEVNPDWGYNNIPQWEYHKLPTVMGCKNWYTARITTNGELDKSLQEIQENKQRAAYIELITGEYDYNPALEKQRKDMVKKED